LMLDAGKLMIGYLKKGGEMNAWHTAKKTRGLSYLLHACLEPLNPCGW
jgi:hypothetical protein